MQNKFIKNIIFLLTKASKDKINRLRKEHLEKTNSKKRAKNLVSLNEARNQQYARPYSNHISQPFTIENPYINSKIIAFVRGWKIRKIMKCQEIINIIKRSNAVSLSIQMSTYNPQTRNFIRDYMKQKWQIVDYFLSTVHRLYRTGEWTKSYKPVPQESMNTKRYNPNLVVNLSTPQQMRKNLMQSTSTVAPPIMHLNSVNSKMTVLSSIQSPMVSGERDMNFNNLNSSRLNSKLSPLKNVNYNPMSNFNANAQPPNQNQRYAGDSIHVSNI